MKAFSPLQLEILIAFDLSNKNKFYVEKPFLNHVCAPDLAETVIALPICRMEQFLNRERRMSVLTSWGFVCGQIWKPEGERQFLMFPL